LRIGLYRPETPISKLARSNVRTEPGFADLILEVCNGFGITCGQSTNPEEKSGDIRE